MIELDETLRAALQNQPTLPIRIVDSVSRQEFVLLRAEDYDRLIEEAYDDSPWTDEEMDLLAAENADMLGWEGMESYQDDRR